MKGKIIAILISLFLLLSTVVLAQDDYDLKEDIPEGIGNVLEGIAGTLTEAGNTMFTLPVSGLETNFLSLLLTFILFFSILFPATKTLSVFKEGASGPRKAFAISFALLVTFFSPMAPWIQQFVSVYLSTALLWGLVILWIFIIWWMITHFNKGMSKLNVIGAESAERRKGARETMREVKDANRQMDIAEKMGEREDKAINNLEHLADEERRDLHKAKDRWNNIIHRLVNVGDINGTEARRLRSQLQQEIGNIMKIEKDERKVANRVENFLQVADKDNMMIMKHFKTAHSDLRSALKEQMARKHHPGVATTTLSDSELTALEKHADKVITNAINCTNKVNRILNDVERLVGKDHKFEYQIEMLTNKVIAHLRLDEHQSAIDTSKEILKEIDREDDLIQEIDYKEDEIRRINRKDLHLLLGEINKIHKAGGTAFS